MPADDQMDDDVVLRRSWSELYGDVVRRGTRLRRRRRLAAVAPVVVAVLGLAVGIVVAADDEDEAVRAGPPPGGDEPALDQRVAFVRLVDEGDGGTAIFVVDGDGSDLHRLSPDATLLDGAPAFSPDGAWIAFQSERDNPQRAVKRATDIYLMRPDGTDVRRLTTTADPGLGNGVRHPAWAPDSAWLAVAAEDAADISRILVLRPDGTEARAITDGPGDVGPVWSPDAAWIAFRRRPPGGSEELWVVRPDGTDARRVVAPVHDGPVAWMPDGSALTYPAELPDGRTRLFTVAPDGSRREQVSVGPGQDDREPAWSSDGRLLVYSTDPDGEYLGGGETDDSAATGGLQPSRLVVAVPGRGVVRTLTDPDDGDSDRGPSLAPPDG
jgi:Tol biopolymer transport system component